MWYINRKKGREIMSQLTEEIKKKVMKQHIQDGGTIASLSAGYGASKAAISNWVHNYRE